MRTRRPLFLALALALVAAAGLGVASPAAAAPAPDLTGQQYVALGDSYSAGFGILPFTALPASGCYQAEQNYPHLVAVQLGLQLDDRTCSGAITRNIIDTPQLTITGAGTAPVQSDFLTADTDVVTVTIGGNDLGFADIAASCIAQSATGPLLSDINGIGYVNCRDFYVQSAGGFEIDLLADRITQDVAPLLDQTFALVRQKAPAAKIVVIGYPALAPDFANVPAGGCFTNLFGPSFPQPPYPQDSFPFTDIDTLYLHGTEARLDTAIRDAATANGATYVSTLPLTVDHSACATGGAAYIAGITLTNDTNPNVSQPFGNTGLALLLGALHPNAAGVAFLQAQAVAAIQAAFVVDPGAPAPGVSPAPAAAVARPGLAESGAAAPLVPLAAGAAVLVLGLGALVARRLRPPSRSPRP